MRGRFGFFACAAAPSSKGNRRRLSVRLTPIRRGPAESADRSTSSPFHYRDFRAMATIGRNRAVAQLGRLKLKGFPAWLL